MSLLTILVLALATLALVRFLHPSLPAWARAPLPAARRAVAPPSQPAPEVGSQTRG